MTKLEEIAMAIGRSITGGNVKPKLAWMRAARKAVKAMREPSDEMLGAYLSNCPMFDMTNKEIKRDYQAMIDKVLENKE